MSHFLRGGEGGTSGNEGGTKEWASFCYVVGVVGYLLRGGKFLSTP